MIGDGVGEIRLDHVERIKSSIEMEWMSKHKVRPAAFSKRGKEGEKCGSSKAWCWEYKFISDIFPFYLISFDSVRVRHIT